MFGAEIRLHILPLRALVNFHLRVRRPDCVMIFYQIQAFGLGRVVADQILQRVKGLRQMSIGIPIRLQKHFVTADKVTAHAGLLINDIFHRVIGSGDDFVGMVYQIGGVKHLRNLRAQNRGQQRHNDNRHGDGGIQQAAKLLGLIHKFLQR